VSEGGARGVLAKEERDQKSCYRGERVIQGGLKGKKNQNSTIDRKVLTLAENETHWTERLRFSKGTVLQMGPSPSREKTEKTENSAKKNLAYGILRSEPSPIRSSRNASIPIGMKQKLGPEVQRGKRTAATTLPVEGGDQKTTDSPSIVSCHKLDHGGGRAEKRSSLGLSVGRSQLKKSSSDSVIQ